MTYDDVKSLSELNSESLYFSLCKGVHEPTHIERLTRLFKTATTTYSFLFDDEIFFEKRNKTPEDTVGHNVIQYILPSVRSVYIKFFIETPTLFKWNIPGNHAQYRLELFQLQFNLGEYLQFLSDKYKNNYQKLDDFENIDRESELLRLIVEDYLSSKVAYVLSVPFTEIQKEIRDSKIDKQLEI